MDKDRLNEVLKAVAAGTITPSDAAEQLARLPFEDLGFAKVDLHRALRQGMPEVIFCPRKTPEQIVSIAQRLRSAHKLVVASRVSSEQAAAVLAILPDGEYDTASNTICWGELPNIEDSKTYVAVVSAGTADLSVAAEACAILRCAGIAVKQINDVGVAGVHRLIPFLDEIRSACAVIVIAGMDGALPSVVGGLVDVPVIAVPTSVGYGASFDGLAALLAMLNSCASGLTVVNIDNGFGAAFAAVRIVAMIKTAKSIS
jgi:pyridinium-3,5-biscarboxylic acid mononucleotide synthase